MERSEEGFGGLPASLPARVKLFLDAFEGLPKPQARSGCNCPFCIPQEDLQHALEADIGTAPSDLTLAYVENLFGTIDGSHEFPYLLPSLLVTWAKEVFRESSAFTQRFHHALSRGFVQSPQRRYRDIFDMYFKKERRDTILSFMRDVLLGRLGLEHWLRAEGPTSANSWMRYIASFGVIADDVPRLFEAWWNYPTAAHAVAAVKYISCLVCEDTENPVFKKPSAYQGRGGPPRLYRYESIGFEETWLPGNLLYFASTITPSYLSETLTRAVSLCEGKDKKITEALIVYLEAHSSFVEQRIGTLFSRLSSPSSMQP